MKVVLSFSYLPLFKRFCKCDVWLFPIKLSKHLSPSRGLCNSHLLGPCKAACSVFEKLKDHDKIPIETTVLE